MVQEVHDEVELLVDPDHLLELDDVGVLEFA